MVATHIFFMFTPNFGEMIPILTSIFFKMGWFNHQLEKTDGGGGGGFRMQISSNSGEQ